MVIIMINTIQPHNTILSFLNKHINPHICKYINPYKYMWTIINKIYIKKNGLTPLTIDKVVSETKNPTPYSFLVPDFQLMKFLMRSGITLKVIILYRQTGSIREILFQLIII